MNNIRRQQFLLQITNSARDHLFDTWLRHAQHPTGSADMLCNWLVRLAGSPRTVTDRLQCVLNAAARIVSGTRKFYCGLTHLLHSELHWLNVPGRIQYKLDVTVHRCLQGKAPQYLVDCCTPTSEVASCQRLRSAIRHQLVVPRYRRSKFGRRAFSVAGPIVWNSLPDHLRDPTLSSDCFKSRLKTHLFSLY